MSRKKKVFISYCHADEAYKNRLVTALKMYELNGDVSLWHDRKMPAGDVLDSVVKEQLISCDIFVACLSPDYLGSNYCYKIELGEAFKRYDEGSVRIVPIILRPCNWKETRIQNFLAAPSDGYPASKFNDEDDAWQQVLDLVKENLSKIEEDDRDSEGVYAENSTKPTSQIFDLLDECSAILTHPRLDSVSLRDIYIWPDLKVLSEDFDDVEQLLSGQSLLLSSRTKKAMVFADEQYGKTALFRMMYFAAIENGLLPVYVDADGLSQANARKLVVENIRQQYEINEASAEGVANDGGIVVLVDNIDKTKLNIKYLEKFIVDLCAGFEKIFMSSDKGFRIHDSFVATRHRYSEFELLPFGHLLKNELINKWYSIGREESVKESEIHALVDSAEADIEMVLRRGVIPPTAANVLTILQLIESKQPHELTTSGHCYQSLIYSNLERKGVHQKNYDLLFNYLTEIAYFMFDRKSKRLSSNDLLEFNKLYAQKYFVSDDNVLEFCKNTLQSAKIVSSRVDDCSFKYKYFYYFFLGKYFAENLDDEHILAAVKRLSSRIDLEHDANVLAFLVHHTKNRKVVAEIVGYVREIFGDMPEANLSRDDVRFLEDIAKQIPDLICQQRDANEERRRRLKEKDKGESSGDGSGTDDATHDDDSAKDVAIKHINQSAKAVELLGQIIKGRGASMLKPQLMDLGGEAVSVAERFLRYFLNSSSIFMDELVEWIKAEAERKQRIKEVDLEAGAKKAVYYLCHSIIFSVVAKVSTSIGSKDTLLLVRQLALNESDTSPFKKLVLVYVELHANKKMPRDLLIELDKEFSGNIVTSRVLKQIVINYLYLHYVELDDKQWVSDKLKIPMTSLQQLQSDKKPKIMASKR